jgi:beta-lactamase superfamily II metal-dependent hydrolase
MLTFHILNVGHGLSVVIEYQSADGPVYGVVDSNAPAHATPKALEKLQQLGATTLSFIALTHPHKDHFSGLHTIIEAFRGRISTFYSFSLGNLLIHGKRLHSLARKLHHLYSRTDSPEIRQASLELLQIIQWGDSQEAAWYECDGELSTIAPPGFGGVTINTILPPRQVKSRYLNKIETENLMVLGDIDDNDLSFALQFDYFGKRFVIGGDVTRENWHARRRFEDNIGENIHAPLVILPHHGSKYDCLPDILSRLFSSDGARAAFSSANGLSHPDHEIILWLEANGVLPYCTNLIPECGSMLYQLGQFQYPELERTLARWLREVTEPKATPQICQGDIMVKVHCDGRHEVITETGNACGYRGDYSQIPKI